MSPVRSKPLEKLARKIGRKVLGKNYELDLVFASTDMLKKLNRKYRGKNKPTNVLAFRLEKNRGQLFVSPGLIKKEAGVYKLPFLEYFLRILMHGLLHLKGYKHGLRMEKAEFKFSKLL